MESTMLNYAKDRIEFDARQHDFRTLTLDWTNARITSKGVPAIRALECIHQVPRIASQLESYRQHLFELFRTPAFQTAYRSFGRSLIDDYFTRDAVIQKTPTVRIQLSGGKSVSYHSDAWYGHGERVNSFWLPLTPVSGSNSLQIARDVDESRAFLLRISAERLNLDEINVEAERLCEPVEADFGDLIIFNGDVVHGTRNNTSGASRVSFDFRIAHSLSDIGAKPKANFYTYDELSNEPTPAVQNPAAPSRSSALMYSGVCRGVTAKSQLVFLNEYAKINEIDIVGSESEIVVFDYAPVLQKYVANPEPNMDCVLLFSVDLLPKDESIRRRILQTALDNRVTLVFGAEDVVLRTPNDAARIEQLYSAEAHTTQTAA